MLVGTVTGGLVAEATNLGVPYLLRAAVLVLTFAVAFVWMHDVGFTPRRTASLPIEVGRVLRSSFDEGLRRPAVRWMMLAGVFTAAVPIYGFYAMQPCLLELLGRGDYRVAGAAAALVAASQIAGGLVVPWARRLYARRTSALLVLTLASAAALLAMGLLQGLIPSEQRATVLSSDNLLGSLGGALAQPGLGAVAQARGYPASYVTATAVELLAVPFLLLAAARERRSGREVVAR